MFRKHFRIRRRVFVGLAFAALAVPAAAQAQTGVFVDGGPVPVSTPQVSSYNALYQRYHAVGGPVGSQIRSEHNQSATITPLQADGLRWQAMARFYQSQRPTQVASTSNSFDWKDAGVGASTVFAAALLIGIAIVLTRRHQHSGLTSA
jgi:hypothetical protein